MKETIVFFGKPGAGKNVQASMYTNYLREKDGDSSVVYIGTGQIIRDLPESSLTKKLCEETYDRGELVPNILASVFAFSPLVSFLKIGEDKHLFFDGYPRNLVQAQHFLEMMNYYRRTVKVVCLEVDFNEAKERIQKRMMEENRTDDNEVSVKKRFEIFNDETLPLVQFFESKVETIWIDGIGKKEEVFQRLLKGLGY